MMRPTESSRTQRREARRDIRNYLGTNGSAPPHLMHVVKCVALLNELLTLSSGGRYRLALLDAHNAHVAITVGRAHAQVREEGWVD